MLDYVYENESKHANKLWLTQPIGGGQVKEYTWAQAIGEARKMATHLKSLGYEPGSKIGISFPKLRAFHDHRLSRFGWRATPRLHSFRR